MHDLIQKIISLPIPWVWVQLFSLGLFLFSSFLPPVCFVKQTKWQYILVSKYLVSFFTTVVLYWMQFVCVWDCVVHIYNCLKQLLFLCNSKYSNILVVAIQRQLFLDFTFALFFLRSYSRCIKLSLQFSFKRDLHVLLCCCDHVIM